jgi:hypothetical protein
LLRVATVDAEELASLAAEQEADVAGSVEPQHRTSSRLSRTPTPEDQRPVVLLRPSFLLRSRKAVSHARALIGASFGSLAVDETKPRRIGPRRFSPFTR